jgi:peptide/nickel transport system substrate-binding protein
MHQGVAASDVVADALHKAGLNVDYAAMDWGTVIQRRAKQDPVAQGGWSAYCAGHAGLDHSTPAVHPLLRGDGASFAYGWARSPALEELRNVWFETPDPAAQQEIARKMQLQAFSDVPYVPLGQVLQPTAYRSDLTGVLNGLPLFWNVRRA